MPLTDEDFFAPGEKPNGPVTTSGSLTDDDFYPLEQPPAAKPDDPGLLDQVRGGYYDLRGREATGAALDNLGNAMKAEAGQRVERRVGSIKGEPQFINDVSGSMAGATPEQRADFATEERGLAATRLTEGQGFRDKAAQIPFSEETLDFLEEARGVPLGEAFRRAPAKIILELGARSAVNMVPTIGAGLLAGAATGPLGFAAGTGAASARIEYVSSIVDGLQRAGVDLNDPTAVEEAVGDRLLMGDIETRAAKRAAAIGFFDALSGGIAGKQLAPFIKPGAGRVAGNLAAQSVAQPALGGAGEAAAQLATEGEISDKRGVAAEMAGELVSVVPDSLAAGSEIVKGKKQPAPEDPGAIAAAESAAAKAKDPVEQLAEEQERVRKEIAAKGGDALDQELAAALAESNAGPEIDNALFAKRREAAALEKAEKERVQKEKDDAKRAKEGKEVGKEAGKTVAAAVTKTLAERRAATAQAEQQAAQVTEEIAPVVTERIPNRDPNVRGAFIERKTRVTPPLQPSPEQQARPAAQQQAEVEASDKTVRTLQEERAYLARQQEIEAQKARDFAPAAAQAELQSAEQRATVEKVNTDAAPAPTLGDVSPALRTLAERRNQEKQNAEKPTVPTADRQQPARAPDVEPAAAAPKQGQQVNPEPRAQAPAQATGEVNGQPDTRTAEQSAVPKDDQTVSDGQPRTASVVVPPEVSGAAAAESRAGVPVGSAVVPADAGAGRTLRGRRNGGSPPSAPAAAAVKTKPKTPSAPAGAVVDEAKTQYQKDLPSRGGLTSMPMERTRAASKVDKAAFDTAMLQAAKEGKVELIPFDDVKRMSAEQRAAAIQDPENKNRFYSHWRPTESTTPAAQGQVEEAARPERTRGRDDNPVERNVGENNVEQQLDGQPVDRGRPTDDNSAVRRGAAGERARTLGERRQSRVSEDRAGSAEAARTNKSKSSAVPAGRIAEGKQTNGLAAGRVGKKRDSNSVAPVSARRSAGQSVQPQKRKSALTRAETAKIIGEFNREAPAIDPVLVGDVRQAPQALQDYLVENNRLREDGSAKPLAVFFEGEVYIFEDNIRSAQDLRETILHEYIGHKGMRALFGAKFDPLLDLVYETADARKLAEIAARYPSLDSRNTEDQRSLAEEYIAYVAESGTDISVLDRIVAFVRRALRKLGFVQEFTENDIKALLLKARTKLSDQASPRTTPAFREEETPPPAPGPLRDLYNMGATVEQQANSNPGVARAAWQALTDKAQDSIEGLLMTVPLRNLKDFMSAGKMDSIGAYVRELQRMDGRRNELMVETDQMANKWLKYVHKSKDGGRVLGELMFASTLSQVDPSTGFRPFKDLSKMTLDERRENARRQAAYDAIAPYYSRLDAEGKALYNEVRNAYAKQRRMVFEALTARINASEASGQSKRQLIDELRQKFEDGNTRGPYFPLTRFGEYWAAAKNKKGETVAFSRFEKPSEQRAWVAEMEKQGFEVNADKRTGDKKTMAGIDPKFVTKITQLTQGLDPQIADEVWQMYLRSMPELSMRKHFIHRKGRLGFSGDALRSFGHTMFHGAHQLAKLEHGYVLDGHLRKAEEEAAAIKKEDPEKKWAVPLFKELEKRNAWVKNPATSRWSNMLTGLGFAWFLAASPAAGLVNLSQTAMVGLPVLGSRFGYTGAVKELLAASAQLAGGRGSLGDRLRGEERAAWDEAKRIGLFGKTQAHDLAGVGEAGLAYDSRWKKASEVASWFFHKAEEINREVTFMAAYRLAKQKGQSQEQAILAAEDATWDSHFDYSSTNRPRVMQGDIPKVLFLFRQYSVNMTYRLTRDFNDSIRGASPARKSEARKRFAGMMGMTALFAGVTGLPMFWAVEAVVNALFDDDDEPFDMSDAMREYLTEMWGPEKATAITKGLVDAYSPVTFSSRVGLNNLWIREAPKSLEGTDKGLHILGEMLGPLPNLLVVKPFQAAKLADDDFGDRAIETLLPKAISDPLKSYRYAREGVRNLRGDSLVGEDELRARDAFMQSIGFSPSRATMAFDQARAIKDTETAIKRRGQRLVDKYYLAMRTGDSTGLAETTQQILRYNSKNPEVAIDYQRIRQSARAREEYSARSIGGVVVDKKMMKLYTEKNISRDLREK